VNFLECLPRVCQHCQRPLTPNSVDTSGYTSYVGTPAVMSGYMVWMRVKDADKQEVYHLNVCQITNHLGTQAESAVGAMPNMTES